MSPVNRVYNPLFEEGILMYFLAIYEKTTITRSKDNEWF